MLRRALLPTLLAAAVLTPASHASAETTPEATRGLLAAPRVVQLTPAEQALASMTLREQVGQLFMVGTPAASADARTRAQVARLHLGGVMLTGRSHGGVRPPARVAARMQAAVPHHAASRLLVGTDQEGGRVQVLQGRGLSSMPTALEQGRWSATRLRRQAERWGRELRRAGVNLNLAPVLDVVPGPAAARRNPPIGQSDRELGYTPHRVASRGLALVRGLRAAGVATAVKHFPGLGRVHANTDTTARVVDRVTGRHDPFLEPFRRAVDGGAPFVMMSTARYLRLDPHHPAAFSSYVVGTLLRRDLGFTGVVISDDLANARQVADVPVGMRAVRFVAAGGDLVLSVDPRPVPTMYAAVLERARRRPAFRAQVRRAALRVLVAKQQRHLLG